MKIKAVNIIMYKKNIFFFFVFNVVMLKKEILIKKISEFKNLAQNHITFIHYSDNFLLY